MIKLYRSINNELHYWETWDKDTGTGIVHWGIIGLKGESKEVKSGLFKNFRSKIQKEIIEKTSNGFREIDEDDHINLLIEYKIDGMGTTADLEKRTRLQNKMDSLLGWTGLGHCDGGSIGSGTMEVCCLVVDFDIAKNLIEQSLSSFEFADYTRIYDETE
jgi:hypothetical protein